MMKEWMADRAAQEIQLEVNTEHPAYKRGYQEGLKAAQPHLYGELTPYGQWASFNPYKPRSLELAIVGVVDALLNTISKHGTPHNLEWIVKDEIDSGYMAPGGFGRNMLPPGYTSTIGWKATFYERGKA